jgi:signal transduction histidine kinase/CheY-like chemotaxis protein
MKKFKIFIPVIFLLSLIGNGFLFYEIYKNNVSFQSKLLSKQVENISGSFEKVGLAFENDVNFVLYTENVIDVFDNNKNKAIISKLQVLYSKYPNLVSNIFINDKNNNVFSLYKGNNDNFLNAIYVSRKQIDLLNKERVVLNGSEPSYTLPIFYNNAIVGNIVINLDLSSFLNKQLELFKLSQVSDYSIINIDNDKIYCNNTILPKEGIEEIIKDARSKSNSDIVTVISKERKKSKFLFAYNSYRFLNSRFIIISSLKTDYLYKEALTKACFSILLNLLLLSIIFFSYYKTAKKHIDKEKKLTESEAAFKQIIDNMPIGIIIIKNNKKIQQINKSARKILMIDDNENLIGEDISHRFFLGKPIFMDTDFVSAFESDHFLHYEKEGNDIIIYKKDIPLKLKGEEVIVQSFIDVTPIEKSRKREIAANMAKSDFLARMSHEIRTPMNGIIGMADSLAQQDFAPEQVEQIQIIRKSADLLLSLLNDILDLSKIEAGKMVLEEIPFKVREEINLVKELFRVPVEEKKLLLETNIASDVPNEVIGDPLRLRQILINLIGNSIKFTSKGKIIVSITKLEEYNRNLTLKFSVEDTGIGIPKDKLQNIFQTFTQADTSTTRRFGGTGLGTSISKQLVELMNGEIFVESPSSISSDQKNPGSIFSFTIELYSNEKINKNISINEITHFNQIKTLIIGENKSEEKTIEESLSFFNVPVEQHIYNKNTVDILKAMVQSSNNEIKLLIIKDSPSFDGFKFIARMKDAKIIDYFVIVIISTNDKQGNYVKGKRNGVDYYIVFPYEVSEIFNFLCETFTGLQLEEEKAKFRTHTIRQDLKILVAEDNFINQKVAKTLFKNIGFEVEFAKNGLEVLDMVESNNYDIIFMDIMMPDMDGIQATIELRKKNVSTPIIAMTANIAKDEKSNAIACGMNDYITKPVKVDVVRKILIKLFSEEIQSN